MIRMQILIEVTDLSKIEGSLKNFGLTIVIDGSGEYIHYQQTNSKYIYKAELKEYSDSGFDPPYFIVYNKKYYIDDFNI